MEWNILIADSDTLTLALLGQIIEDFAVRPVSLYWAKNEAKVLQVIQKKQPDLAIVDQDIPLSDITRFCETARQLSLKSLQIIIMVTEQREVRRYQSISGPSGVLLKPIEPEECIALLNRLLE